MVVNTWPNLISRFTEYHKGGASGSALVFCHKQVLISAMFRWLFLFFTANACLTFPALALEAKTRLLTHWKPPVDQTDYAPVNGLPDGIITYGEGRIASAWLEGPTTRYDHGVIGDAIEARTVAAQMADGRILRHHLDSKSVFEDRMARIVDVDGDGEDEILVIRSYLEWGSAVAILAPGNGELDIVAENEPIYLPFRWLNPVGVADFDGDGETEIAIVETPHIGGTLRLLRKEGRMLKKITYAWGFSNHAHGSRNMSMSLVEDLTGDGIPEIVLPGDLRRRIRVVSFAGGTFNELLEIPLPEPASQDFILEGERSLIIPLQAGRAMEITFIP